MSPEQQLLGPEYLQKLVRRLKKRVAIPPAHACALHLLPSFRLLSTPTPETSNMAARSHHLTVEMTCRIRQFCPGHGRSARFVCRISFIVCLVACKTQNIRTAELHQRENRARTGQICSLLHQGEICFASIAFLARNSYGIFLLSSL